MHNLLFYAPFISFARFLKSVLYNGMNLFIYHVNVIGYQPNIMSNHHSNQQHSPTQKLDNDTLKRLKGIGHELKPIVSIGGQGLSQNVLNELNRALDDHELVKVKLPAGDKQQREALAIQLAQDSQAQLVHQVGRMALLLRHNPQANPKLSNLMRFG